MLQLLQDTFTYLIPLFVLFGIFMVGYYFAWTDFKPRIPSSNEEWEAWKSGEEIDFDPIVKKRELTLRELGINDIDNRGNLSAYEQRQIQMKEIVKNYTIESPEDVANVIKSWLKEN